MNNFNTFSCLSLTGWVLKHPRTSDEIRSTDMEYQSMMPSSRTKGALSSEEWVVLLLAETLESQTNLL